MPLPDELIDSYLLRCERLSGFETEAVPTLAAKVNVRIDPLGKSAVHRCVWESEHIRDLEFADRVSLGMSSLFAPFMRATDTETGQRLKYDNPFPYGSVCNHHFWELSGELAQCPLCTKLDIDERGFGYWKRKHQVKVNVFCLQHGFSILSACPACHQPFSNQDLPQLNCSSCHHDLTMPFGDIQDSKEATTLFRKIATYTDDILSRRITKPLNLEYVGQRVNDTVACRVPGRFNNVARMVQNVVGTDRLRMLDMHPRYRPVYGWPAMYLRGNWPRSSPCFELVLAALFGGDLTAAEIWSGRVGANMNSSRQQPTILDLDFLRHLYHATNWSNAGQEMGQSSNHVRRMFESYPGLKQRIECFRKRKTTRRKVAAIIGGDNSSN